MSEPLKIALIDYDPRRGHATLFSHLIRDRMDTHGCQLIGYYGLKSDESRAWCCEQNVSHFRSIDEMAGRVDGVVIPAASDPEVHEELFGLAASLDVPIYLDKPLAHRASAGRAIFEHAEARKIPVASSSALRFATEMAVIAKRFPRPEHVAVWGGNSGKLDEFLIHPLEVAIAVMGRGAVESVTLDKLSGGVSRFDIRYPEERLASVFFHPGDQKYELTVADQDHWERHVLESAFFIGLIERIFAFFRTRVPIVHRDETITILEIIDHCRTMEHGETRSLGNL